MKKLFFAIRTLLPPFGHTLHVGLLLLSLLVCASAAGENEKQPSPIRHFNEFQGVYVGDKQPSGKTRVILHRKGQGDSPEVHLVNGKPLAVGRSPRRRGFVIGEVELQTGQPIEVYSVVLEVNVKPTDEELLRLCRESGNKPFRLEASQIPLQHRKLIETLSKFDALCDENRPYVGILFRIGKRAHPDLLTAYLGGNKLASAALGEGAQPEVARIWEKLSEADRWKLIRLPGCVARKLAVSQAVRSLDADSIYVRREAVQWLGKNKASEAKPRLLEKLHTDKSYVRYHIVGALAEIGGEDVVDAMIELLAPDSWAAKGQYLQAYPGFPPYWYRDGRTTIIAALAMLKAKRSAPALLKVLQEKGNGKGYLGEFIIPVLGDLGYGEAIPELKTILATGEVAGVNYTAAYPPENHPAEQKRVKAIVNRLAARALLQLGDRSGCALLGAELANTDYEVRRFVAETFARFGDKADIPTLERCRTNKDAGVYDWAGIGLKRINKERDRDPDEQQQLIPKGAAR